MTITIEQIDARQTELATMIAKYKEQAAEQIVEVAAARIEMRVGERYAGIVFENGQPHHHLILLPQRSGTLTWQDAQDWAQEVGGELPTRFESALLYANLRDEFDQSKWHWTATQYSDDFAWNQTFAHGTQYDDAKAGEFLARIWSCRWPTRPPPCA
jgi:hypothetical protein